jgi:molecular chaperone DnaK (HSP70)
MPAVKARLAAEFPGPEILLFDPDLAVAKGAALYGVRVLAGEAIKELMLDTGSGVENFAALPEPRRREVAEQAAQGALKGIPISADQIVSLVTKSVRNVCSKGFGIVVKDEAKDRLFVDYPIVANTPVPAEETRAYKTSEHSQRSVDISIREPNDKDSPEVDATREICEGVLTDLPPGLKKGSKIVVTFRLEEDGTLRVTAVEPKSGKQVRLETNVVGTMTDQEITESAERMLAMSVS